MYNRILTFSLISFAVLLTGCNEHNRSASTKAASIKLETVTQKASYSFGVDVANRLTQQGVNLDPAAFNRGIADAFAKKKLALSKADRTQAKTAFQTQLREQLIKKQTEIANKNLAAGKAFLAANAKKPGVITTKSGLQYKILKTGHGPQPKLNDTVTTNYRGTLIDGTEFDNSYKRGRPATFPVNGVIKGWTEALQLMHVGDKWQLFVPSDLAYGKSKRSEQIQPNSTLIFEVELLGIKGQPEPAGADTSATDTSATDTTK